MAREHTPLGLAEHTGTYHVIRVLPSRSGPSRLPRQHHVCAREYRIHPRRVDASPFFLFITHPIHHSLIKTAMLACAVHMCCGAGTLGRVPTAVSRLLLEDDGCAKVSA